MTINFRQLNPIVYGILHMVVFAVCSSIAYYISSSAIGSWTVGGLVVFLTNFVEQAMAN